MNDLIKKHFEKIRKADASALEDYSENLVCIARVGGIPQTFDRAGAKTLLARVWEEVRPSQATVLVDRTTEDTGVLTLQSDFAPFVSYACIAKNGKIIAATLYLYRPVKEIELDGTSMPSCKEAGKMFWKHFRAMFSMKARVIVKDYAEDGVVITNMTDGVCNGKGEIYRFCDRLMKSSGAIMKKMDLHGITSVRWKVRSAGEGLLLFTMEAPAMNMVMTETYWVRDGKIQFECSIAHGAMLQLVRETMK